MLHHMASVIDPDGHRIEAVVNAVEGASPP